MPRTTVMVRLPADVVEQIDERRGLLGRGDYLRRALGSLYDDPIEGTHAGTDPAPARPDSVAGARARRREQTAQALRRTEVTPHFKTDKGGKR